MGRDIQGRLRRLEEQADPGEGSPSEEQEKAQWLAEMRFERMRLEQENPDVVHARGLIGLFRTQNFLPGMSFDELVNRILAWRGGHPVGGWSRTTTEREVGLAIHRREPGTEGLACPPAWRMSFAAGDELRERYAAAADEDLASYYVQRARIEQRGGEAEFEEWAADYEEELGIARGLEERAVGPDVETITAEERQRRIDDYLADLVFGEKGYRVWRHMGLILGNLEASRGEGVR